MLAWNALRVVSTGKPVGHNVNEAICHYSDSPAIYIEGVRDTVLFDEVPVVIEGIPAYQQTVTCIVAKDRPDVMAQLISMHKKRYVVVCPDRNGYKKMIGTKAEPALFLIEERSTGDTYDTRNEMKISFSITRKDPAYNYTVSTAQVQTVGVITIGKRVAA